MSDRASPPPPLELAVEGAGGLPLRLALRLPDAAAPCAGAVVLHGFKGFRDWGFFPELARDLAASGLAVASVQFSHNGVGADGESFDRPERFERNCLAFEVEETGRALAALAARPEVDPGRLALLGHSRGGAVALLAAAGRRDVAAVVGWSTVGDWRRRFPEEERARARARGFLEVVNARTGQTLRVGARLLAEMEEPAFDPAGAAAAARAALLLVHGDADETVPLDEARRLAAARAGRPTELVVVAGAGHAFGATHPFRGRTPELERALAATRSFLGRALSRA